MVYKRMNYELERMTRHSHTRVALSKKQPSSLAVCERESIATYCRTTSIIAARIAFTGLDSDLSPSLKETSEERVTWRAVTPQIDIVLFIQTLPTFGFRSSALYFFMPALRRGLFLHSCFVFELRC